MGCVQIKQPRLGKLASRKQRRSNDYAFIEKYKKNFVRIQFKIKKDSQNSGFAHGTGFIINEIHETTLALTCMHNLRGGRENDFKISGVEKHQDFTVYVEGDHIFYEEIETFTHPNNKDIALIKFLKNPLRSFQKVTLEVPHTEIISKVCVFGYQKMQDTGKFEDLQIAECCQAHLFTEEQNGSIMNENQVSFLRYNCKTVNGFSGAPILSIEKQIVSVIGVHTASDAQSSKGVALTQDDLNWISEITNKIEKSRIILPSKIIPPSEIILKLPQEQKVIQKSMRILSLENSCVGNQNFVSIISSCRSLKKLYLASNPITFQAFQMIPSKVSSELEYLDLGKIWPKEVNIEKRKRNDTVLVKFLNQFLLLEELLLGYDGCQFYKTKNDQEIIHTNGCVELFDKKVNQLKEQKKSALKAQNKHQAQQFQQKISLYQLINSKKKMKHCKEMEKCAEIERKEHVRLRMNQLAETIKKLTKQNENNPRRPETWSEFIGDSCVK